MIEDIQNEELRLWMQNRITQRYILLMREYFDPHMALLGYERGQSADRLIGRAEVLEFVINPEKVFEGERQ